MFESCFTSIFVAACSYTIHILPAKNNKRQSDSSAHLIHANYQAAIYSHHALIPLFSPQIPATSPRFNSSPTHQSIYNGQLTYQPLCYGRKLEQAAHRYNIQTSQTAHRSGSHWITGTVRKQPKKLLHCATIIFNDLSLSQFSTHFGQFCPLVPNSLYMLCLIIKYSSDFANVMKLFGFVSNTTDQQRLG